VAAAAAGGTMGNSLDFLEGFLHILELVALLQRLFHVKATDLFAVADHIVYHKNTSQC